MALEETTQETTPIVDSGDRKSVIAAAVAAAGVEDAKEAPVEVKEEKEKPKEEEKTPKTEPTEDQLLAEQGKQLMLALRDPQKSGVVIKFLAEQAGYTKSEIKAAAASGETEEMTDDILSVIKAEMGEEFDVISERLAKALNKILPAQLEKSQADIRQKFQADEAEKLKGQSADALTTLTNGFFGDGGELPADVEKEMSSYMDRVNPSPNSTVKEYMADAFHYAIGKLGLVKTDPAREKKIERNRSDAPSRLASARAPSESNIQRDSSKPISRQDAIRAAIEAASKE